MKKYSRELPMELVTEVLVRLPVKSLVRFRCVCKAWFGLISSSDFASLHLSRSHKNDGDPPILVSAWGNHWMLISGLTYEKITSDDCSILNNQNIMKSFDRFYQHGCSVNGLVLLSRGTYDPLHDKSQLELVILNPMIGKSLRTSAECHSVISVSYGFGFSHTSNDYKVVVIDRYVDTKSVCVYSFRTRTWRRIVGQSESIALEMFADGQCLIDGKIHFLNRDEGRSPIAVFDIDNEEFTHLQRPCFMGESYAVAYYDRLGLCEYDYVECCCNLWVMGNDQAPESWRKLYTIRMRLGPYSVMSLCFNKGEELMLLTRNSVDLYNVKSGERKHLTELSSYRLRYSTFYKESLVLL